VRHAQRGRPVADARRLAALGVAEERDHPRLVVGDPLRDHVAELLRHQPRVLGEALGRVARRPAAAVLQRLREIPVVQRGDRLDPALEQPLDEAAVEADAARVERAAPVRLHPRPGDREAVALDPHRREQVEVLAPAVVVVAGDVAGVPVDDVAGRVAEAVPDRLAAAVLVPRALDLVRRGRRAELEARRVAGRGLLPLPFREDRRHPFTAPAVRPFTSHRWVAKKASMTGSVDTTPAAMSCAYSCE
jgi:hypothetical protein